MASKLMKSFAKKWNLDKQVVFTIFGMIRDSGRKYGKTHKTLKSFGIKLSTRQLKYFYRKIKLHERIDFNKKGRPRNYPDLLRKL